MATYRAVVRHVRYWRGTVHRWSTVYPFSGSLSKPLDGAACGTILQNDALMCFGTSAADGGAYQAEFYSASAGGAPIVSNTVFDWQTPGAWVGYTDTNWPGSSLTFEPQAEVALQVEWPAGISKTGKPVSLRKWYHSVAQASGSGSGPSIGSPIQTALQTQAQAINGCLSSYGLQLGTATGRFAGTPVVLGQYGNHQMPRGRRKKKTTSVNQSQLQNLLGILLTQDGESSGDE